VAKLADALDLGSSGVIHVGSIPITRTINPEFIRDFLLLPLQFKTAILHEEPYFCCPIEKSVVLFNLKIPFGLWQQ
jgi:hypothetical protein